VKRAPAEADRQRAIAELEAILGRYARRSAPGAPGFRAGSGTEAHDASRGEAYGSSA
jgi:hypothetical protein